VTTIMTVCTGNICRSPAAELLLREYLGDLASVSSTGTHAMRGHGIPAEMLMCLDVDGIDGRGHTSTQFKERDAREADLIITMTARHRAFTVSEAPATLKHTFLLTEIAETARAGAELAGDTPTERLANLPDAVRNYRPALAGDVVADVPDPYGRGQARYDEAYAMIKDAIVDIDAWVRG